MHCISTMQYNCITLRLLKGIHQVMSYKLDHNRKISVGDLTQSCYYSRFKSKYDSILSSRLTITNQSGLSWKSHLLRLNICTIILGINIFAIHYPEPTLYMIFHYIKRLPDIISKQKTKID